MNKLRKIVLTAAALGALAVGGAAFAQAQNGSNPPTPVQQSGSESAAADTDAVQSGDTAGADRNEGASEQGSEAPDAHEHNDAGAAHEAEDGD